MEIFPRNAGSARQQYRNRGRSQKALIFALSDAGTAIWQRKFWRHESVMSPSFAEILDGKTILKY